MLSDNIDERWHFVSLASDEPTEQDIRVETGEIANDVDNPFIPLFLAVNYLALRAFQNDLVQGKFFSEVKMFVTLDDLVDSNGKAVPKGTTLSYIVHPKLGFPKIDISLEEKEGLSDDDIDALVKSKMNEEVNTFISAVQKQNSLDLNINLMREVFIRDSTITGVESFPVHVSAKHVRLKSPKEYTMRDIADFIALLDCFYTYLYTEKLNKRKKNVRNVYPSMLTMMTSSYKARKDKTQKQDGFAIDCPVQLKRFKGTYVLFDDNITFAELLDALQYRHEQFDLEPKNCFYFLEVFASDYLVLYQKNRGRKLMRDQLQQKYDELFNLEKLSLSLSLFDERLILLDSIIELDKSLKGFYMLYQAMKCQKKLEVACAPLMLTQFRHLGEASFLTDDHLVLEGMTLVKAVEDLDPSRLKSAHSDDRDVIQKHLCTPGFLTVIHQVKAFLFKLMATFSRFRLNTLKMEIAGLGKKSSSSDSLGESGKSVANDADINDARSRLLELSSEFLGHSILHNQLGNTADAITFGREALRLAENVHYYKMIKIYENNDNVIKSLIQRSAFLTTKAKVLRLVYDSGSMSINLTNDLKSLSTFVDELYNFQNQDEIPYLLAQDYSLRRDEVEQSLHEIKGDFNSIKGDYLSALSCYGTSIKHLDPKSPRTLLKASNFYVKLTRAYLSHFSETKEKKYLHLGELSAKKADLSMKDYVTRKLSMNSHVVLFDVFMLSGDVFLAESEMEQAMEKYDLARKVAKKHLGIVNEKYARVMMKMVEIDGQYMERCELAVRAFFGQKSNVLWKVMNLFGKICEREGETDKAKSYYKMAFEYGLHVVELKDGADEDRSLVKTYGNDLKALEEKTNNIEGAQIVSRTLKRM